jgi:hypothetical protein
MATMAMMHFSTSPPEPVWAKDPNDEEPLNRKGPRLPDRWGRYPDQPSRPDDRWQQRDMATSRSMLNTNHRLIAVPWLPRVYLILWLEHESSVYRGV